MEKGAISADMIADAFASATAEGQPVLWGDGSPVQTFSGQVSTLQDGVAGLKGALAGGLSSLLASTALPAVNSWVDSFDGWVPIRWRDRPIAGARWSH